MAADKEYIERGSIYRRVKTHTNPYGKPTLDYESGVKVLDMIKQEPAADVVSRGVYDQVKWERDMAMQQLEEHGIPFGGTADNVVEVRHGEWIKTTEPLGAHDVDCVECSACGESWILDGDFDFDVVKDFWNYCPTCGAKMDGERKERTCGESH